MKNYQKLPKTTKSVENMLTTLNNTANNIGMANYKIKLNTTYKDLGDNYAEATWDYWEKIITITLSKAFKKKDSKFQQETLIHEIVHARIGLAETEKEKMTKSIRDTIEEKLANDLTTLAKSEVTT